MRKLISLALVAATLAVQPGSGMAATPTIPSLEGGYIIYHGNTPFGCQVVANPSGDGSLLLFNERGYPPAIARPVPGNPYRYTIEGGGWDCKGFTLIVTSSSIHLLFDNHTEWIRPI
jgi:hypothetical protein